ncbi:aldo/keto reductase [Chitinophaga qingshengii]|uniref:Aldo/keto reductase n=1 Tax=Chitinophaga qingshengii TaxID=1569794 RepID=A0ABR7TZ00_9BACT|nr:aldo/keto reductase [Chitinophaga qingshengii]MBC9934479.1 aldo/keto reductase [Chitinophaga qingshengii]
MELTHFRTLGRSGLRVSPVTLGTMTFGLDWQYGATPEVSKEILAGYLDRGGNMIDTANIYTRGHSEKIIGDYLKTSHVNRDWLVLATKFFGSMRPGDPNSGGTGRKAMIASLEASLRRLQTDYIDLYWMHAFDAHTPIEETLYTLDKLVQSGKVRYIGISDTPAWKIAQAQTLAHFRGWPAFIGLQLEYSLLERSVEAELIPMAGELQLGVMPWSPLKQGVLSGKYTRQNKGQTLSQRATGEALSEKAYDLIDALQRFAADLKVPVAAIALAWVMGREGVTSIIIGARTTQQLQQNLQAMAVTLPPQAIAELNALSTPESFFPYTLLANARHIAQGGATINGNPSVLPAILPQHEGDHY